MFRRCVFILSVLHLLLPSTKSVLAAVSYNVTDLGIVGCPQAIANAINPSGDVVGYYYTSSPLSFRQAFIYRNGTTNDLGVDTLFDGAQINPMGINARRQVVGLGIHPEPWVSRFS